MERSTARPLNFDDSEIEGSSYDEYSGSGMSESSEDESQTDTSLLDIPYGHPTMQADTLVQQLPGWGKASISASVRWKSTKFALLDFQSISLNK